MSSPEKSTTLLVEGMTCVNCANTVQRQIAKKGARDVSVNFATKEAIFTIDNPAQLPGIIAGVNEIGYRAVAVAESGQEDGHSHAHSPSAEKRFYFTLPFTLPLLLHMALPGVALLHDALFQLALCLPVYITGMAWFGRSAWGSLKAREPNMDVLIATGASAAFFYSLAGTVMHYGNHEVHSYLFFETAATIITLVLLGNVLEQRSVKQTTTAIGELSRIRQVKARRIAAGDRMEEVDYEAIRAGDVLQVNTGDKIPVDGKVAAGEGSADESMITGESLPASKMPGSPVIGGTILVSGSLRMKAERVGSDTLLSQIISLVKNAQLARPQIQRLGDRVSAIFVPAVLAVAAATFGVSHFILDIGFSRALMNSIAVLVISCPCAMGLATPTAVMVGIGRAARQGILIKGGTTLEALAGVRTVIFDKTGTLTTGEFRLQSVECLNGFSGDQVRSVVAALERHSSHPIALSLLKELAGVEPAALSDITEEQGGGVSGSDAGGNVYRFGSPRYAGAGGEAAAGHLVLARNNTAVARLEIGDTLKKGAAEAVSQLRAHGMRTVLLSGDSLKKTAAVAQALGIEEVYGEKLPHEKLEILERLAAGNPTAMVGDGVNDAPALARASVGISIGNATQAAIQSAQVVLLGEKDLSQLSAAFRISRHTLITIKQNLFWAFFYNVLAIPVAAAGYLSPMIAALSMAFSDVIVVGNSIRLKSKKLH